MGEDKETEAARLARVLLESVGLVAAIEGPVQRRANVPAEVAFAQVREVDRVEEARRMSRAVLLVGATPAELRSRLTEFLSEQYRVPAIDLRTFNVKPDVVALLPAAVARAYAVVPLKLAGETLVIATNDPSNESLLDAVARFTGFGVDPVVAALTDIDDAIARYYGS